MLNQIAKRIVDKWEQTTECDRLNVGVQVRGNSKKMEADIVEELDKIVTSAFSIGYMRCMNSGIPPENTTRHTSWAAECLNEFKRSKQ